MSKKEALERKHELNINTDKRLYKLDGKEIGDITTRIKVDINNKELPKVTIEMEPNIVLEGTLLNAPVKEVHCQKCNYTLGIFVGSYSVVCPNCKKYNINY